MTEKYLHSEFEILSKLDSNAVINILSEIECMEYSSSFRDNKITGYDLCFINSEILKNELNVQSFHDRNEILKYRNKLLLLQYKVNIVFEDKRIDIQLDVSNKTTLNDLVNLVKSIYKINDREFFFFSQHDELLSYDCKIGELILIDPLKYKNLKIKSEINKFNDSMNDNVKVSSQLNKTPNYNINNYMDIGELDEKNLIYSESDNKYKNNYLQNNIKLSKSTNNNYFNDTKKDYTRGLLAKELENSNTQNNENKSIFLTNKTNTNILFDEKNEKSHYSSKASTKNDFQYSSKKVISSNKQSPEKNKNLIEKIIDGYDKNNEIADRELNNEIKKEDFNKKSLQNYNSKINQILNRNPSLDEKQFDITKSSDLKLKIDSMRSEISDSLRKDKETSFNKRSTNNESFNSSMRNNQVFTKNKNNEKLKHQLQKHQLKNISLDVNLNNEKN